MLHEVHLPAACQKCMFSVGGYIRTFIQYIRMKEIFKHLPEADELSEPIHETVEILFGE